MRSKPATGALSPTLMAGDRHAERLAPGAPAPRRSGPDPEGCPDGLAVKEAATASAPTPRSSWAAHRCADTSGVNASISMMAAQDRRAVDAVDIGHQPRRGPERRLIGDAVDAGAERLDPFRAWARRASTSSLHHRTEGEQDIGVGGKRRRLAEVIGDVDVELGKALFQSAA